VVENVVGCVWQVVFYCCVVVLGCVSGPHVGSNQVCMVFDPVFLTNWIIFLSS
jgi:hypothetical protein